MIGSMNVVSYEAGKTEGPAKVENPKNESLTSYLESLAPYLNSLKELNSGEKMLSDYMFCVIVV